MLETNAPAQMVANARCLNGRNGEILAGPWEREAAVVTPIRYPRPRTRIRRGPTPGLVSPDSPRGAASRYSASMSPQRDLMEFKGERPELERPFLVVYLAGWTDSGIAGQTALGFLHARWNARTIATFDSDELIDYRARGPVAAQRSGGGGEHLGRSRAGGPVGEGAGHRRALRQHPERARGASAPGRRRRHGPVGAGASLPGRGHASPGHAGADPHAGTPGGGRYRRDRAGGGHQGAHRAGRAGHPRAAADRRVRGADPQHGRAGRRPAPTVRGRDRRRAGALPLPATSARRRQPLRVMAIAIEVALRPDGELAAAFARLVPQLSSSSAVPDQDQLRRIVEFPGNRLLVARDRGGIVGMLTLVMFPIPTGLRARIEDVVVDQLYRRLGFEERASRVFRHNGPV